MKVEGTGETWANRPEANAGKMAHNEQIEAVLLADGWHWIRPKSFRLMKTAANPQNPGVAFCIFDIYLSGMHIEDDASLMTVQIFPNQLHGVAYGVLSPEEEDDEEIAVTFEDESVK